MALAALEAQRIANLTAQAQSVLVVSNVACTEFVNRSFVAYNGSYVDVRPVLAANGMNFDADIVDDATNVTVLNASITWMCPVPNVTTVAPDYPAPLPVPPTPERDPRRHWMVDVVADSGGTGYTIGDVASGDTVHLQALVYNAIGNSSWSDVKSYNFTASQGRVTNLRVSVLAATWAKLEWTAPQLAVNTEYTGYSVSRASP